MIDIKALFKISYGMYIVSSGDKDSGNGFISNTVFQVTSSPARFVASCNKNNYTSGLILKHRVFSVTVLGTETPSDIYGTFGYKSGKDVDKLEGMEIKYGETGVPVVLNSALAVLEFELEETIDIGTHNMFVGRLVNAEVVDSGGEPATYAYYRDVKKGMSPKNAPTYIDKSETAKKDKTSDNRKYKCPVCGYVHDNATEPVNFNDLPDDWTCPVCGVEKSDFTEL